MTRTIDENQLTARLRVRLEKYLRMARNLPQGEIDARTAFKLEVILPNVGQAIGKLDDGTYGVCIDCGDDICVRRLLAVPAALRCLACQEDLETERVRAS